MFRASGFAASEFGFGAFFRAAAVLRPCLGKRGLCQCLGRGVSCESSSETPVILGGLSVLVILPLVLVIL